MVFAIQQLRELARELRKQYIFWRKSQKDRLSDPFDLANAVSSCML